MAWFRATQRERRERDDPAPRGPSLAERRDALLERLRDQGTVTSDVVVEAMRAVDRAAFLPPDLRDYAWADSPQSIGEGQTISAPHMVALMVEALDLAPGQRVLEIGTGSGYHAAVAARLVAPGGHVHTVERFPSLAAAARANLMRADVPNVTVHEGDGSLGLEAHAPYDCAYLTCAAPDFPPAVVDQVRDGGRLLAPLGDRYCDLTRATKGPGGLDREDLGGCVFVPLVGAYGFP